MSIRELWYYLLTYHRGKTYGAIGGIVFGLLTVLLGWKILILIFFALIGLVIGKSIDDNIDPKEMFRRMFGD